MMVYSVPLHLGGVGGPVLWLTGVSLPHTDGSLLEEGEACAHTQHGEVWTQDPSGRQEGKVSRLQATNARLPPPCPLLLSPAHVPSSLPCLSSFQLLRPAVHSQGCVRLSMSSSVAMPMASCKCQTWCFPSCPGLVLLPWCFTLAHCPFWKALFFDFWDATLSEFPSHAGGRPDGQLGKV